MLAALAQTLRTAVDIENGFVDLRSCLAVADALDSAARLGLGAAKLPRPEATRSARARAHPAPRAGDADALRDKVETALELRKIFGLRTIRQGYCLSRLLMQPGTLIFHKEMSSFIDCSYEGVKVYLSQVRSSLAKAGFADAIINVHGKGYYMPAEVAQSLEAHMRTFLSNPRDNPD